MRGRISGGANTHRLQTDNVCFRYHRTHIGQRKFVAEEGRTDAVNAVCISDDNNFVLGGGDDMVVSAFDFRDGQGRGNRIKQFGRKRSRKAERPESMLQSSSVDHRTEYHRSAIRSICMIGKSFIARQ